MVVPVVVVVLVALVVVVATWLRRGAVDEVNTPGPSSPSASAPTSASPSPPSGGRSPDDGPSRLEDLGDLGDFETGHADRPRGWEVRTTSPAFAQTSAERSVTGERSVHLSDPARTSAVEVWGPRLTVVRGGVTYLRGQAYLTLGKQDLALVYFDSSGNQVARIAASANPSAGRWVAVQVRGVAPAGAVTARAVISSSTGGVAEGWWDAVYDLEPTLGNGSFEATPTDNQPVPGWGVTSQGQGRIAIATSDHRTGRRSVVFSKPAGEHEARLTSSTTPVFGGATTRLRLWLRMVTGAMSAEVAWYGVDRELIAVDTVRLDRRAADWQVATRDLTAPLSAVSARVSLTADDPAATNALVDDVSLVPASDTVAQTTDDGDLGVPLEDFANVPMSGLTTVAGRAKAYAVVSGYPAHFQVVDVATGAVETNLPFEDPTFGRTAAMVTAPDGSVYVGGQGGGLYRWDVTTRRLQSIGRATPAATSVISMAIGPDGRVWAGTYPDGALISIDPRTRAITNHGQVASGREYVRSLAADSTHVYAGVGSADPIIVRLEANAPERRTVLPLPVKLTSGQPTQLAVYGSFLTVNVPTGSTSGGTVHGAQQYLYDLRRQTWRVPANRPGQAPVGPDSQGRFHYVEGKTLVSVDSRTGRQTRAVLPATLATWQSRTLYSGTLAGVNGDWLVLFDSDSGLKAINVSTRKVISQSYTFRPVSLRMKSLTEGPEGSLYVGGFGGASLAVVDPSSGQAAQYPLATGAKNVIGEVEGMVSQGQYQFLGTYPRGRIFRYDSTKPWVDGQNPTLIADLSTSLQDRPQAWATSGSRTFFGTVPAYGRRGGVLGVIDSPTATPRIITNPVGDQSIVSLMAAGRVVIGGTSRWGGLGAAPSSRPAGLFAYDTVTNKLLWSVRPLAGAQSYGAVLRTSNGQVWAASGGTLLRLDSRTGVVIDTIVAVKLTQDERATWRDVDLEEIDGKLYLAAGGGIHRINLKTRGVLTLVPSGAPYGLLATIDHDLYYPAGATLRRIEG